MRVDAASMMSAETQPWVTRASTTATAPATVAPTIGMNAPRKTRAPIAAAKGTRNSNATTVMPTASTSATMIVARVNATSCPQATYPLEATFSRATRGNSRTTHAQMRSPS